MGGADCDIPGGGKEYWPPSKLENAWITTQEDMARFSAWCFEANPGEMAALMEEKRKQIKTKPKESGL